MGAANSVIAGDYKGKGVIQSLGDVSIVTGFMKSIPVNASTVSNYEVIDEKSRKSATSAVGRAAVGAFLLGPVGLAAGLSAKSKGAHTVAIYFKDGKKSLVEIDDKIYKALVSSLF